MEESINLSPTKKFLTAKELLERRKVQNNFVKHGLKKRLPDGSPKEQEEIRNLQNMLYNVLSTPRIDRSLGRSRAEWDPIKQITQITKKEGKFEAFGFSENGLLYLNNYETLFLIELNRLELYFNSVLVSIEHAYILLLGEERSYHFDNYLIYSILSRAGYRMQIYTNDSFKKEEPIPSTSRHISLHEECIWEILFASLDPKHTIPEHCLNYTNFDQIKHGMDETSNIIKNQTHDKEEEIVEKQEIVKEIETNIGTPSTSLDQLLITQKISGKRKLDDKPGVSNKRQKINYEFKERRESYLNQLINEPEYIKFEKIFNKIDVIQLRAVDEFEEDCRDLRISFNMYLPSESYRKTDTNKPGYSVIVLGPSERFPERSELIKLYRKQTVKTQFLVASVSESKHVQCFLYYFT